MVLTNKRMIFRSLRCCVLVFFIGLSAAPPIASADSPQQPPLVRGKQSDSKSQHELKEDVADAARNAVLWAFSWFLPLICFAVPTIAAIVWVVLAFRNRISIFTGTVTIAGHAAKAIKLDITTTGPYKATLYFSDGMFTVYDIPADATLAVTMSLLEPGNNTPDDKAPSLTYSDRHFGNKKPKTLNLDVRLPLLPSDLKVDTVAGDDSNRTISWQNPHPTSDATSSTISYNYSCQLKTSDKSQFSPITMEANAGIYKVIAPKGSIIECTSSITGMSHKLVTYINA